MSIKEYKWIDGTRFKGIAQEVGEALAEMDDPTTDEILEKAKGDDRLGQHFPWGDPLSLLIFPKLDLVSKVCYSLQMFVATERSNWSSLEHLSAKYWFVSWGGQRTYDVLWKRHFAQVLAAGTAGLY